MLYEMITVKMNDISPRWNSMECEVGGHLSRVDSTHKGQQKHGNTEITGILLERNVYLLAKQNQTNWGVFSFIKSRSSIQLRK